MNIGVESETVEFKSGIGQLEKAALSLSAMMNKHNHGKVYIGVEDNGDVCGIDIGKDTVEKVRNYIDSMILPKCLPEIEILSADDRKYLCISCSGYSPAYSFNGRYYIRNITSNITMTPEMLAKMLLSKNVDAPRLIQSPIQNLTFTSFDSYLTSSGVHARTDRNFFYGHGMLDKDGKFNLLAYLLSDQNDVPMQIIVFEGKDKSAISNRTDFGRQSLLTSANNVLDYIKSYQTVKVDLSDGVRKETKLFDMESFREAWINACVHNDWKSMIPPSVFVFDDRIEIQSYGTIPFELSIDDFYMGKSIPVNKSLFDIFILAGYAEQSGHGVQTIVKKYGKQAISMGSGIITVTLNYAFVPDRVLSRDRALSRSSLNDISLKILEYLENNPTAKTAQIYEEVGMSLSTVKKTISKLKTNGFLVNNGNTRLNKWEVLK